MKTLWNEYHWYLIGVMILFWIITKTSTGTILKQFSGSFTGMLGNGAGNNTDKSEKEKREKTANLFWLTAGWVSIVMIPLFFDQTYDWWKGKLLTKQGIGAIVAFTLFGAMMAESKIPFRFKLAKYGIWLTAIATFLFVFGDSFKTTKTPNDVTKSITEKVKGVLKSNTSPYYRGVASFQIEADRFWYGNIPSREAWDMMDIIKRETGFRHFNPDGSVVRGIENPSDIGLHQINLEESKDEIAEAGCNVEELDCNFKVALLIYRKYGLKRWVPYETVKNLPVSLKVIPVPADGWSEVVYVDTGSNCHRQASRNMVVRDSSNRIYDVTKESFPPIESPTQQYAIKDGEGAGTVEVRCR